MKQFTKSLWESKRDFRIIPFGFVLLYILAFIFSEIKFGSYTEIGRFFGIKALPYFRDLKILLCGVDAIRDQVNPYAVSCYNEPPMFNYPYTWGFLSFIPFITVSNLFCIAFGLILLLFTALYFYIGKINFLAAIVYTLLFISPAVMLGFERGNCDLIILLLLLIPLFYKNSRRLFAFVILISGMLKLFPIGAGLCLFQNEKNKIKRSLWLFISVIVIFIIFLFIMKDNILLVSQRTPRPFNAMSYGLGSLPSRIAKHFTQSSFFNILAGFVALLLISFVIFYRYVNRTLNSIAIDAGSKGMSYIIGASIFITTCLIGYNWEYRLVFLVLTIPQVLHWASEKKRMAKIMLFLSLLIVWQSFIATTLVSISGIKSLYNYSYMISPIFVIFLFCCHLSILIKYFSNYYKSLSQIFRKNEVKYSNTGI